MSLAEVERSLILLDRAQCGVGAYVVLFRACGNLRALSQGRIAHAHCIRSGHHNVRFVGNLIVDMYGRCGAMPEARRAFDSIAEPDVYSWTIVISAYARNGYVWDALDLFRKMHLQGIKADAFTFTIILDVCTNLDLLEQGRKVHLCIEECGFESEAVVATALVHLYGKCGDVSAAQSAFEGVPLEERDLPCWSSMIAAYAQNGHCKEAFRVFHWMSVEGMRLNAAGFSSMICACSSIEQGRLFEQRVVSCGYGSDVFVQTALVTMFGRLGSLDDARRVFYGMKYRNTVSWSAMLAAYAQHGHTANAVAVFREMDLNGVAADAVTYINLLSACPSLAVGRLIHKRVILEGYGSHPMLGTSLVNMYGKHGELKDARATFDMMPRRNLSTWNAMLTAYLNQERGKEALLLYELMEAKHVKLDRVSLMCVLNACANLGDLHFGLQVYAKHASNVWDSPSVKTTLMNLYGKCGRVDHARSLFDETRNRDVVAWNAMLTSYARHGHQQKALDLFWEMLQDGVLPDESSFLNILFAMSHGGRRLWDAISYFGNVHSDFGILPVVEHYSSLIDVLGRCGWLEEAEEVLLNMPFLPNESTWLSFLSSCKLHGNMQRVTRLSQVVSLEPGSSSHYVIFSNIFSETEHRAS